MTVHEVLRETQRRGILLTPEGTSLRFCGPKGALNEELKRELVRHKLEILALLVEDHATYPCPRCRRFAFVEPDTVCYWCHQAAEAPHEA